MRQSTGRGFIGRDCNSKPSGEAKTRNGFLTPVTSSAQRVAGWPVPSVCPLTPRSGCACPT
jgi:hypothetical protein